MESISFQDSKLLNEVLGQFVDLTGVGNLGGANLGFYDRAYRNPLISKVVSQLPRDATKFEPKFLINGVESKEISSKLQSINVVSRNLDSVKWLDAVYYALVYSRLYGDGFLILGYSDSDNLAKPLSKKGNLDLNWMAYRSRREVSIDINKSCYVLTTSQESKSKEESNFRLEIHPSRVIRFSGFEVFEQDLVNNSYYNHSIIDGVYPEYCKYSSATDAISKMIQSHSAFSYGINDLAVMVKQGKKDLIRQRFETILNSIARIGGVAYDKTNEEVSYIQRSYSGLKDLLDELKDNLLAVSGLPSYKLWGKANTGALSTASESEADDYSLIVNSYQYSELDNPLVRLVQPLVDVGAEVSVQFLPFNRKDDSNYTKNGDVAKEANNNETLSGKL